jgi:hypothetical protein
LPPQQGVWNLPLAIARPAEWTVGKQNQSCILKALVSLRCNFIPGPRENAIAGFVRRLTSPGVLDNPDTLQPASSRSTGAASEQCLFACSLFKMVQRSGLALRHAGAQAFAVRAPGASVRSF